MRQGEVYRLRDRDGVQRTILVVTGDGFNVVAAPHTAIVVRRAPLPSPYLVRLAEEDPVAGVVSLARLYPVDADLGDPVGMLTGATWARIREALGLMFDL